MPGTPRRRKRRRPGHCSGRPGRAHSGHRVRPRPRRAPGADARAQGPGRDHRPATWDQETYLPAKAGAGARRAARHPPGALPPAAGRRPQVGEWLAQAERGDARRRQPGDAARCSARERDRAVTCPRVAGARARRGPVAPGSSAGARRGRAQASTASARRSQRLLELRREQADAMGHGGERYDALLDALRAGDDASRGSPRCWSALRAALVPLVRGAGRRGPGTRTVFDGRTFDPDAQWQLHPPAARAARLRLEGRPAGPEHPPVHRGHAPHRRAAHHADRPPATRSPRCLRHDARGRPWALRAGLRRGAPPHAAGRGALDGAARVASPASGRTWSGAASRSGGSSTRGSARPSPRRSGAWSSRSFTGRSTGSSVHARLSFASPAFLASSSSTGTPSVIVWMPSTLVSCSTSMISSTVAPCPSALRICVRSPGR